MSDIWFIRGVPREFRERVTADARKRRQTVGELVVELLTAGLEHGHQAADQAVNVTERLSRLEQDFRQQIEQLTDRVATLEARRPRSKRLGMPVATKSADSHQRRPERAGRPVAEGAALFVGDGAGRRLTAAGEAEVMRRHMEGESMKAIGRMLGISDRTVAAVIARTRALTDGHL